MREILLMDASADICLQKKSFAKTDDLLNITGVITLRLSTTRKAKTENLVSITSKVLPYKYQWSLNPMEQAEGVTEPGVRNGVHDRQRENSG